MNKKIESLFFLLLLFSACKKKEILPIMSGPSMSALPSFSTISEAPKEQPQFLSHKNEKEVSEQQSSFPGMRYDGPIAIPNQPLAPPPPFATDDDLAWSLD